MPVAASDRLLLRKFTAADARAMAAVFCDPEVMRFSDGGVRTAGFVRGWIAEQVAGYRGGDGLGRWAIVEAATREVIGYVGLTRAPGHCGPDEAELGFRLARPCWGRGYASEAAAMAIDHGAAALRLRRIVAIVDPGNLASVRVVEKLGMRFERAIMFDGYTHPDRLYAISIERPG